jgi:hypothetical protein
MFLRGRDLIYEGFLKNNKANGIGRYFYPGNICIDGVWKDDELNGFGVYTSDDGVQYEG